MRFVGGRWCAAALLVILSAWPGAGARLHAAPPAKSKLDQVLQAPPAGLVSVIVSTKPGEAGDVAAHLIKRGRSIGKQYSVIDALAAEVGAGDLAALDADPDVTSVAIDATVASVAVGGIRAAPSAASPYTLLPTLGLPSMGLTGKGVGVAVIDSGLQQNGDFSGINFYDFTSAQSAGPYDDYGHGTHVSGLIASKGNLSLGLYSGIAPRVRLISLKVLDANGQGPTSTVISAIEFAVLNKGVLGIDVINLSLGHPIFEAAGTDPLVQAVEAAVRAGIVVVVSAGNVGRSLTTGVPGYAGILSPGNAPSAITVGALDTHNTTTRSDDTIPAYSSRGPTWYDALPKPDVVAPGQGLISDAAMGSTLYTEFPGAQVAVNGSSARFLQLGGTSMSAAVTSGVVALMIEASRNVSGSTPSPGAIKAVLGYSALPLAGPDSLTQGHGAINPSGAVTLTLALAAAGWPDSNVVASVTPLTTIAGQAWSWAQFFDEDTVVWGNNGGEPAWATTVVWGNIDWDDTVVWGNADTLDWGDTVVWGNTDGWGDTVVWGNTNGIP